MTPQHYPIVPGLLYGGEYPGDRNPEIARMRILSLVEIGVRAFIDLTTEADQLAPSEELLADLGHELGFSLRRISIPVRDMDVPDRTETMQTIMDAVRDATENSPAAYIHCWGGIGRTGTVVGCWLRECGLGPDEALDRVQHLYTSHMPKAVRIPESPQTPAQKNYVLSWQPAS